MARIVLSHANMSRLVVVSLFAGCAASDPIPEGSATVLLSNRDGVPLAGWPVVFHDADGTRLGKEHTDLDGRVTGPMNPGGMVTYRSPFPADELVTRGGVQLDALIVDGGPRPASSEPSGLVFVATPGAPAEAQLVEVGIACGTRVISARGVPGAELRLEVPRACPGKPGPRFALATATDHIAQVIAYDLFPVELDSHATVPRWRDDFLDQPATIAGLGSDLDRYGIEAEIVLGEASRIWVGHQGHGPAPAISAPLRLPVGIPGTARYRLDAFLTDGELVVEQQLPPRTPFALGPADLPPRITEMTFDGDAVAFTTERPIDAPILVDAVLYDHGTTWRLTLPDGIRALPDADPGEFPLLASFTPDTLELIGLELTYADGDRVVSTARPFRRSHSH